MWKNLKPQASTQKAVDYGDYVLSGREKCLYLAEGLLLVGIFAYFFYRSIGARKRNWRKKEGKNCVCSSRMQYYPCRQTRRQDIR